MLFTAVVATPEIFLTALTVGPNPTVAAANTIPALCVAASLPVSIPTTPKAV